MAKTSDFIFPSDSAIWRINRERALLLTGGRVLLMQIAHPMVAEAVYNHSYVFNKPLLRLHRTLTLTLAMVYGTRDEVHHAVAEIAKAHRPAIGQLSDAVGKHPAGARYNARDPHQGLWVFATLVEGAISGYEWLVAPLSDADKQAFYQDSATIADLMNIPESVVPVDYAAMLDYMRTSIAEGEVAVSPKARQIAPFITGQSLPVLNMLSYPVFRFSVGLLPPTLQQQFGYEIRHWEQRLIERFCRLSRWSAPHLPPFLRYAPEYRRAMRLCHR